MPNYNLALILRNDDEFLLLKQTSPPKFGHQEYDSFVDSDIWDLPSAKLELLEAELECGLIVEDIESLSENFNHKRFNLELTINQVLAKLGFGIDDVAELRASKMVQEADFGPGLPVHTVFITGNVVTGNKHLSEVCKWMSVQGCLTLLLDVKPSSDRIGQLVVAAFINGTERSVGSKVDTTLLYQEYPPGVVLVPMKSRTAKPFHTTNLVIFAPEDEGNECEDCNFIARGDALIVDPGCHADSHAELLKIVAALSRKLVVFVTHHHHDHVDGLSVIQKCNPDATLLAHENTMRRIGKGDWSLGYTSVSGGEDICIGGQRLSVIFAPGHTDGHTALLHISTNSLIVGDHCVGQGSAVLDVTSGGNMTDYFHSTYKFIELSPHVLIPMHGRVNLWPKHMLCEYLKNRRNRETSILKAIENGGNTLFDIVSKVYCEVDRSFWKPAASNVRLHVDHLAQENKLPEEFSIQKFRRTCGMHFLLRWTWTYLTNNILPNYKKPSICKLFITGVVASFAVLYSVKNKLISK